jgi:dCMP deaminase
MPNQKRIDQKVRTFGEIVKSVAELSSATTKKVGCIAVKKDFSKIGAFGYNGSYPGAPVNPETGSEEESLTPGESGFIHAEINMIAKFKEPDPENYIIFLTLSPCKMCTKVLANAGFKMVYWLEQYRDTEHWKIFDSCEIFYGDMNSLEKDYSQIV